MPASDSENRVCSVGSYLRESRESRGIPLDEAARITRIGKNYLTALEEDMFDALPNAAYVKGFLRAYAVFLGLSGDELVAMYERAITSSPHQPVTEKAGPDTADMGKLKASRRGRLVVPVILLALVVAAAYVFDDKGTRPEKSFSPPVDASPAGQVTVPVQPPRSSAQRRMEAAEIPADKGKGDFSAADTVPTVPQGGGIVLKLKVNQDSWLNITIDDAISQQYDLKAGDLIEWKGDRVVALDIGNAGGIEAELNGKPLKPFGEQGKPAHAILKADGTSP